jgi:hypothetical protein
MEEKPLLKYEAFWSAVMTTLHLVVYYGVALSIWGLTLKKSIFWFGLYGVIAGLLISLVFVAPVIVTSKTKDRVRDMMFSAGAIWGNVGILIGILGIIIWIVRVIFFR